MAMEVFDVTQITAEGVISETDNSCVMKAKISHHDRLYALKVVSLPKNGGDLISAYDRHSLDHMIQTLTNSRSLERCTSRISTVSRHFHRLAVNVAPTSA